MAVQKVLINGAGIAGLSLGAALGQRGVGVDIVEVKSDADVQGIGISVPANALRALDRIGVTDEFLAAGLVLDSYRLFDHNGENGVVVPMPQKRDDGLPSYVGVPRPAYANILSSAARRGGATISLGTTIEHVVEHEDAIEVTFSNGGLGRYDVLVGADGIRSATRRRLFGAEVEPLYAGVGAWRVELPRPEEVTYLATYQGVGSQAGLVPINHESMYLFFADADRASQPEHVFAEPSRRYDILKERLKEYGGIIGQIREEIKPTDNIIYTPFERVLLPLPWHLGRSIVIGDAAHAMSANISQGATSALEDAVVLAEELTAPQTVEEALAAFEKRRYPRTSFLQELSLQRLLDDVNTDPSVVARRNQERLSAPAKFAQLDSFLRAPI